jgi:hypothetical protein
MKAPDVAKSKMFQLKKWSFEDIAHYSFIVRGKNIFSLFYKKDNGWFRIFGKGLEWKNSEKCFMFFSERNGYKKGISIGKWRIYPLNQTYKNIMK